MEKDFDAWNKVKQRVHSDNTIPDGYKEREVWWISLGHNVGYEEDGKNETFTRPVLIVKGFSKNIFWGVPLSTTSKSGEYYYKFELNNKESTALLSQLRTLDTKRFKDKIGMISAEDFKQIKKKLRQLLS